MFLEVFGEVAYEEAEVVLGPLGEGGVGPGCAGGGADVDFVGIVVGGGSSVIYCGWRWRIVGERRCIWRRRRW